MTATTQNHSDMEEEKDGRTYFSARPEGTRNVRDDLTSATTFS